MYISHNHDGALMGLYVNEPAAQSIRVDIQTWNAIATDADGLIAWRVVDGAAVRVGPPPPPIAEMRALAERQIDAICDALYTPSASRDARYRAKHAEALRYREAGYPGSVSATDYPYLAAEAPARSETKRALADLVIARAESYTAFGAQAEAARAALHTAADADACAAIVSTVRDIADQITSSQEA
ncbi:MAG: hypothetical protein H6931_17715 [Burkholderiaceae bacterium]|nr:hypothetical protein [Zoogloeaceae bacterium]MCP5290929.1 hypothetical protein [Burkholderiaceae bacterium]